MKQIIRLLMAVAVLVMVFAPVSADVTWTGTFVLGSCCEPNSLDPAAMGISQTEGYVINAMYEGLTQYSRDGEIAPRLATSWDISDDALTYTLALRDGVQFHDGSALDSEDVVVSIERHKALGLGNLGFILAPVASVTALDDMTVEIQLSAADFQFWAGLPHIKILSADAIAANEADGDMAGEFFRENVVGTGPYELARWDPRSPDGNDRLRRLLGRLGRSPCRDFHRSLRPGFLHAPAADGGWRSAPDRLGGLV